MLTDNCSPTKRIWLRVLQALRYDKQRLHARRRPSQEILLVIRFDPAQDGRELASAVQDLLEVLKGDYTLAFIGRPNHLLVQELNSRFESDQKAVEPALLNAEIAQCFGGDVRRPIVGGNFVQQEVSEAMLAQELAQRLDHQQRLALVGRALLVGRDDVVRCERGGHRVGERSVPNPQATLNVKPCPSCPRSRSPRA